MYLNINNINLYYEKYGTKEQTIVILPGWGDTRKTFDYLINYLKDYFTIYILDYPGFGNSTLPNKSLTIYEYADLIYEFINSLNYLIKGCKEERIKAIKFLIKLLIGWLVGMALAVSILANVFDQGIYKISSLFLGLVITSIPIMIM